MPKSQPKKKSAHGRSLTNFYSWLRKNYSNDYSTFENNFVKVMKEFPKKKRTFNSFLTIFDEQSILNTSKLPSPSLSFAEPEYRSVEEELLVDDAEPLADTLDVDDTDPLADITLDDDTVAKVKKSGENHSLKKWLISLNTVNFIPDAYLEDIETDGEELEIDFVIKKIKARLFNLKINSKQLLSYRYEIAKTLHTLHGLCCPCRKSSGHSDEFVDLLKDKFDMKLRSYQYYQRFHNFMSLYPRFFHTHNISFAELRVKIPQIEGYFVSEDSSKYNSVSPLSRDYWLYSRNLTLLTMTESTDKERDIISEDVYKKEIETASQMEIDVVV